MHEMLLCYNKGMKKIENKKLVLGAASFILAAFFLFLFLREGKKTQLSVNVSQENVDNQTGETVAAENKGENGQEEMVPNNINNSSTSKKSIDSDSKSNPKKAEEGKESNSKVTDALVSWGYQKSDNRSIDTVIIHSSYDSTSDNPYNYSGILAEYKGAGVSPHYLIDRGGKIYRFVEDKNIAYHAGISEMPDGRTNVNNFSIGIELMNTKTDKFMDNQYSSLKYLLAYLRGKYPIKNVLGHDDIAPDRKDDPWNFDWNRIK